MVTARIKIVRAVFQIKIGSAWINSSVFIIYTTRLIAAKPIFGKYANSYFFPSRTKNSRKCKWAITRATVDLAVVENALGEGDFPRGERRGGGGGNPTGIWVGRGGGEGVRPTQRNPYPVQDTKDVNFATLSKGKCCNFLPCSKWTKQAVFKKTRNGA